MAPGEAENRVEEDGGSVPSVLRQVGNRANLEVRIGSADCSELTESIHLVDERAQIWHYARLSRSLEPGPRRVPSRTSPGACLGRRFTRSAPDASD